jgi:hypothetical protein
MAFMLLYAHHSTAAHGPGRPIAELDYDEHAAAGRVVRRAR